MRIPFTKMHGAGNDFVVIDERSGAFGLTPAQFAWIADRRRGIGCDQVILLQADRQAEVFVRFVNSDGSEAGACGNGSRCVAALVSAETGRGEVSMRTLGGRLTASMLGPYSARVDLGEPRLDWRDIPLSEPADTLHVELGGQEAVACSMGNPHATLFVDDLDAVDVAGLGARLEWHPMFPQGANIGFAQRLSDTALRLLVWERGAGLTLACGSGACATLVNAHRRGLVGRRAEIEMPGGVLEVEWTQAGRVLLTGPVASAFTGSLALGDLPA
ncbi:diaminopimelate epimerase [Lichenicoccus sp.]|uniref:diaminopimelate epimerase n=1 Tax=Lichenicoccus sp. TaxID=2781899 RepID=UPI003D13791C